MTRLALLTLALLAAVPTAASAQRWRYARNEISFGPGVQFDLTGWEPAGLKLFFEYARRVGPHGAVAFQVNSVVLPGVYDRDCHVNGLHCPLGFSDHGYSIEGLFGGKWRWHARRAPVLGTFDLTFGLVGNWSRPFGDDGLALVARAGGGLVVMLAAHFGLRFDAHITGGPGFWGCSTNGGCGSTIHPYVTIDTGPAAEFVF